MDPVTPRARRSAVQILLDWLRGIRKPGSIPDRTGDRVQREKLRAQVEVIRRAFDGAVATAGHNGPSGDDSETTYLFRPDHALVRDERIAEVLDFFERRPDDFAGAPERIDSPVAGLTLVRFPQRRDRGDNVLTTLDELDAELSEQGRAPASPDHVLYVTNRPSLCPATEPQMPPGRIAMPFPPPVASTTSGAGVRVSVVDTGLWDEALTSKKTPWMQGVLADPDDLEVIDPHAIHPYGGHGTFVAGVVRCMAPGARVEVEGVLTHGGAVYESAIVAQLDEALKEGDHPQLISISAGSHTRNGFAMLSFEMLASTYGFDDGEQTLIVAAAGNDGSKEPFWPAAFPWVAAVGSVDPDGKVSNYSNYGPWVDVYARGRDIVNAFPSGTYTCYEAPHVGEVRTFDGMAQWSGTSFSTPIVTGLIATRMSETGEPALTAFKSVMAAGAAPVDPKAGQSRIVGPLT